MLAIFPATLKRYPFHRHPHFRYFLLKYLFHSLRKNVGKIVLNQSTNSKGVRDLLLRNTLIFPFSFPFFLFSVTVCYKFNQQVCGVLFLKKSILTLLNVAKSCMHLLLMFIENMPVNHILFPLVCLWKYWLESYLFTANFFHVRIAIIKKLFIWIFIYLINKKLLNLFDDLPKSSSTDFKFQVSIF